MISPLDAIQAGQIETLLMRNFTWFHDALNRVKFSLARTAGRSPGYRRSYPGAASQPGCEGHQPDA